MEKILVSACLLGNRVRYDGGHHLLEHPIINHWRREGRLVAACRRYSAAFPPHALQRKSRAVSRFW